MPGAAAACSFPNMCYSFTALPVLSPGARGLQALQLAEPRPPLCHPRRGGSSFLPLLPPWYLVFMSWLLGSPETQLTTPRGEPSMDTWVVSVPCQGPGCSRQPSPRSLCTSSGKEAAAAPTAATTRSTRIKCIRGPCTISGTGLAPGGLQ